VRLDLDAQVPVRAGARGADAAAVEALEGDGTAAAGKADAVGDVRHGADGGELFALARHEDDALLRADVDRQRDGHCREDDRVVDRNQQHRFLTHGKQV
jgi:hypothetical protein